MANKKKASLDEKNVRLFAEMVIQKMESMKADWKKPWISTEIKACPQNISGRPYNGGNKFLLMLLQEMKNYRLPVYMTFNQAKEEGVSVKRGETGFPIPYYNVTARNKETGEKIPFGKYKELPEEERKEYHLIKFIKYFTLFNIGQTTFPEVKKEKWGQMVSRFTGLKDERDMSKCPGLDHMLEHQAWVCPIYAKEIDRAFYSLSKDEINMPTKRQFASGEGFYGTLLHEMAHSTGTERRLNRGELGNPFGSDKYAREELVAELTSATVANEMGMQKTIDENNVAYLQSWIDALGEKPEYLMEILSDVSRAGDMILAGISKEREKAMDDKLGSATGLLEESGMEGFMPLEEAVSALGDEKAKTERQPIKKENDMETNGLFSRDADLMSAPQADFYDALEEAVSALGDEKAKTEKQPIKKENDMEAKETDMQKKAVKDGINIFKMENGFYGINKVENGERTKTHRIKPEDLKAFFMATKDQPKEVRAAEAARLFDKYFNNEEAKEKEQTSKEVSPLPKLDGSTRDRISDIAIFKMRDGHSYAVRAKIDGEQQPGIRVNRQDVKAFFDGYKELGKEGQAERKAELAGKYYKDELSAPREQISKGLSL